MQTTDLPFIGNRMVINNDVAGMDALQAALYPYLPVIHTFWWALWWGLLAYLVSRNILLPLLGKRSK